MRRIATSSVVLLVVTLASVLPGPGASPAPAPGAAKAPAFHAMPCPAGAFPDKLDVDCGYVVVPEDRSKPHGRQIHVAAAVVHAVHPEPGADPILLLPGGASASSITRFSIRVYLSGTTWDDAHDVVLVDSRGVGLSTPHLGCPQLDAAGARAFYAGPYVGSRYPRLVRAALRSCRRDLVQQGVAVDQYNSREASADLEVLRRALGADRWNLLAISADGVLGMNYLRLHPQSFRSVIVDSGMSPQMRGLLEYDYGQSADLEEIFAGCSANLACRTRYPHLRRDFLSTVARLQRHPVTVHLDHFRPHPERMRIDGVGLYYDAVNAIYPGNVFAPEEIHGLLDDMWQLSHGSVERKYQQFLGNGPVTNDHESRYFARGRTMSLECHDTISAITPAVLRQAADDLPWYAARYRGGAYDTGLTIGQERSPAGCRVWRAGRAPAALHTPVVSDVPTLVMAGQFDGGVPDYIVHENVAGLAHGTYVLFPAVGHQQLAFFNPAHQCARDLARAFLADPDADLDTACVDAMPAFDFTPPDQPVERAGAHRTWRPRPRGDVQVG